jgi:hypothetical protein
LERRDLIRIVANLRNAGNSYVPKYRKCGRPVLLNLQIDNNALQIGWKFRIKQDMAPHLKSSRIGSSQHKVAHPAVQERDNMIHCRLLNAFHIQKFTNLSRDIGQQKKAQLGGTHLLQCTRMRHCGRNTVGYCIQQYINPCLFFNLH